MSENSMLEIPLEQDGASDFYLQQAAIVLAQADGLLITAGAGMGVDSGLPDFHGEHGFWKTYPALGRACIKFTAIANPRVYLKCNWC